MKKFAYIVFFIFITVPAAAQYDFRSDQNFPLFICNYYVNPQPEKIIPSWEYYVNSTFINANYIMMAQFYAAIFKENSSLLTTLFDHHLQNKSIKAKLFMLRILGGINTPESMEYLVRAQEEWKGELVQDVLDKIKNSKHYEVLEEVPRNTDDLDRLWGIFWATGNKKAIRQIISVLYLWEEGYGTAVATGGSAMWSLTKYAAQHPIILQIIIAEKNKSSGTKKKLLEEIVNKADIR